MTNEELINTLKKFDNKKVEQLPENSKKLFDAIMKIADDKDKFEALYKAEKKILHEKEIELIDINEKIARVLFYISLDKESFPRWNKMSSEEITSKVEEYLNEIEKTFKEN